MKHLEIENGDFPPKRIELVTVPSTPCVQPKGMKSVEKTSDSVKVTATGRRSPSHFPPKKKLSRQLVFTEFGLSPILATSPPFPMKKLTEMDLSPQSPFSSMKSTDSPIPCVNIKANSGTPKGPKQCGCKQSKCLKLYCDCFASGEYCNGCICADCCNNVENEDLRKAASEIILERNPHAFKPKISSSPCSPQDVVVLGDKMDAPQVGRHERGCQCKKSECLKRYCECFQANVFCSQNCKCVDCKNFEVCKELISASCEEDNKTIICKNSDGCEGRIAISPMDNTSRQYYYKSFKGSEGHMTLTITGAEDSIDSEIYTQRDITRATSEAAGFPGQRMFQESRKKKHQELHSKKKNSPSQSFSDLHKVINRSSCPSTLSVEPTCHIINSAMVGSFRDPYRLKLANVYHLLETRKVCSGLTILAEAAALAQAANLFAEPEVKDAEATKNVKILEAKEEDYRRGSAQVKKRDTDDLNIGFVATDVQEGRALPPGIVRLTCNEKLKRFMEPTSGDQILNRNLKNAYAERERSVLSSFLDFLEKLIISQNMKVDDDLVFPFSYLLCVSGIKISCHQASDARAAVLPNAEGRN